MPHLFALSVSGTTGHIGRKRLNFPVAGICKSRRDEWISCRRVERFAVALNSRTNRRRGRALNERIIKNDILSHGYTRLLSNRPNRYGCAAKTSPCPLEHHHR
jgi:hypothetical protein